MSTLPAAGYINNATRTEGELKQAFEDLLAALKQIPGAGVAETTLTIASDTITLPGGGPGTFAVDTEAAAAQDNLATIVQTNFQDGSHILLHLANTSHVVTIKHNAGGAGQITLNSGGDFTLGAVNHWLLLKRSGTSWLEVYRIPSASHTNIILLSALYTVLQSDRGSFIDCTSGTFSITLPAAALAGRGFELFIRNSGSGVITIDPNAAELINGAATLALNQNDCIQINCDGTAWKGMNRFVSLPTATNAEVVAGTSNFRTITPQTAVYQRGYVKAFGQANFAGALTAGSYQITSVTDNGTGDTSFNLNVTFSTSTWTCMSTSENGGSQTSFTAIQSMATNSVRIQTRNDVGALVDAVKTHVLCIGDIP